MSQANRDSSAMRKKAGNQSTALLEKDKNIVHMKIGYPPEVANVQIDKMKSRMGRATESHFAVLNTKIIERKQASRSFDPEKVLNPALRATIKNEDISNRADFIKVKALFMSEEAR